MNEFERGLLTSLSKEQLQAIQSKHIGIAGTGGLGSNIAIILTRCGFNQLTMMDFDKVEAPNLNRQQFTLKDIGKSKVQCLASLLISINPDMTCPAFEKKWEPDLSDDPFLSCDILVEAFDGAETKASFLNYYSDKIPYIVSGNGMAGISGPPLSITQHGNIFIVGDSATDTACGHPPMAPRVTTCAAMMAQAIFELTLNAQSVS